MQHIKRTEPKWDRTGRYAVLARELADRTGADVGAILDEHGERAAIRLYDGGLDAAEAEERAWSDVLGRFEVRQTEIKL